MKKDTLKIILVVLLVLAVPGGIVISYILVGMPKYHTVSDEGNTDAADKAAKVFNIYALVNMLGADFDEFYKLNPSLKDVDYVPYGTRVKYRRK